MRKIILYTMCKLNLTFLGFIFLFLTSCSYNKSENNKQQIFSTSIENFDDKFIYDDYEKNITFESSKYITKDKFFSGKHSVKISKNVKYALTTTVKLKPNQEYIATVRINGNTKNVFLVVSSKKIHFYKQSNSVINTNDKNGWKILKLRFSLPENNKDIDAKIYIWNNAGKTSYLDDFEMHVLDNTIINKKDPLLIIHLNKKARKKLDKVVETAKKEGIINQKKWIKAMVFYNSEVYKTKLRIKGDWLDHISGRKKSFRIKIRNNAAFKGMKVFSIQKPSVRHYLDQWLFYGTLRNEGLLAPRYGFVPGMINDEYVGYYAYEEHFEKQLVESAKRREGSILKFSEDAFWDMVLRFHNNDDSISLYPLYEASKILPFNANKTLKNKVLATEFKIAQNLAYQHKYGLAPFSDIFDVDKAAKFFAMMNVFQGWHGLRWHNQRFYYNPILCKLEYVSYDNYVNGDGIYKLFGGRYIYGNFSNTDVSNYKPESIVNLYLLKDSLFRKKYVYYLKKYSSKEFLDSLFAATKTSLEENEKRLLPEYPEAKFNKQRIYDNAKAIKKELPQYIKRINNRIYDSIKTPILNPDKYNTTVYLPEFLKDYVNIYLQDSKTLRTVNYFPDTIKITAIESGKNKEKINGIFIPPFASGDYKRDIKFNLKKVKNAIVKYKDKEYKIPVMQWPEPMAWTPRQELEQNNKFPNEPYYSVLGNLVIFSGKHKISSIILIPTGYKVVFKPGTDIDFVNGGGFLSYSSVYMRGLPDNKIKIHSSDNSARGFTVLQADSVVFDNVEFKGLNTFDYKGWTLSGAVTVYETDVYINNSSFTDNVCEDDLNLVRTNFIIKDSYFANTFSDAFDSDFSNGTVSNSVFKNLGNDAIDFSTSKIDVINCVINSASDKGVSGGEASIVKVKNCVIDGANIGIASKDKSVVTVENTVIKDVTYGLTAFTKKPEYGPAKITIKNVNISDYVINRLIEKGSVLVSDGKVIPGIAKNVAKKFY